MSFKVLDTPSESETGEVKEGGKEEVIEGGNEAQGREGGREEQGREGGWNERREEIVLALRPP